MQNRKAVVSGLVITALAFAGACSDAPPTEPAALGDADVSLFGAPANPQSYDGALDSRLVQMAQHVPGFGGYYRGDDGRMKVVMKAGASAAPLSAHLGDFDVVAGQYDFIELESMKRQARQALSLAGVVYVDADEKANRVVIGVEDASAAAWVERGLGMVGVPLEAVELREMEPVRFMQTLQQRVRPVAGGLQINFPGFLCTLGFNVRSPNRPNVHGFVTNSHCTNVQGSMTNTPYWQPTGSVPNTSDPNFIGNEQHDVPFFTGGICPAGRICRWSDAAGARYAAGVDNAFARIYRTTGVNNQSLIIDGANPMFTITAERPFPNPGDTMNKVGRTTGWSSGTVTSSCADVNVGGTNITLLCQEIVTGGANAVGPGDSGSPVFDNVSGNNVRLVGILWGGSGNNVFVFSAMNEVRFENEGPAPWVTH